MRKREGEEGTAGDATALSHGRFAHTHTRPFWASGKRHVAPAQLSADRVTIPTVRDSIHSRITVSADRCRYGL